jgi:hypothetical protein
MNYIDDVYTRYVREKYIVFQSKFNKNCSRKEFKRYLEQDIKTYVLEDLKIIGINFKDVKFNFDIVLRYDFTLGTLRILADNKTINLFHKKKIEIERLSKLKNIFEDDI